MTIKKFVEKINHPEIVRLVLPLIVLLEIGRTFYHTNAVYVLSRVLLLYFLLFAYSEAKKNKQLKVYIVLVLLFGLWALATTIWSYDPMITFPRAFYFAYAAIGASTAGYLWYAYFSKSFLSFLLPANIIIVVVSLFSLITNQPADAWTGGCGIGFKGFAPHQNVLGMMILLTIPSVLLPAFSILKLKFKKNYFINFDQIQFSLLSTIFYLLLLFLNIYILILTQSRGSVMSVLLMVVTFVIFTINWKILITTGLTLVLFIAALFFASPEIKTSVTDYIFKTENTIGDRRSTQINATISAAKNGGLIGLGYGISDPKNILGDVEEGKRYYREKMISVLALIEEVGVIGLAFFLAVIGYVLWLLFSTFKIQSDAAAKTRSSIHSSIHPYETVTLSLSKGIQHSAFNIRHSLVGLESAFMIAVLVALSFDAQIEGWWLGAGSWQFFLFFSLVGNALATEYNIHKSIC